MSTSGHRFVPAVAAAASALLVLGAAAVAADAPVAAAGTPAELTDLDRFLAGTHAIADLPTRLEAVTRPLLGARYKVDPLGEGASGTGDTEPLWSFTLCDCQTLVEQGLALAFARNAAEFRARMKEIRYLGDDVAYEERKHLVAPRWLPTLVADGYLRELTAEVGRAETAEAPLVVSRGPMEKRFEKLRARAGAGWPYGEYSLRYVPLEIAMARHGEIPPGTVLLPVKEPRAEIPFLVSHMGFVLHKEGKRIIRHAASSPVFRKVVDQSVRGYLSFLKRYFAAKERPVVGVALYRVTDPGPLKPAAASSTSTSAVLP